MADNEQQEAVQDDSEGGTDAVETFTPEQVDEMLKEKLAELKAESDTAFGNLWEEAKAAKARAKTLEQQLSELREAQQAGKAGVNSEEVQKLKAQIRAEEEKRAREALQDELEKAAKLPDALAEIRNLRLDSKVKAKLAANGAKAERIEKLWKLEKDRFDLTEDGVPMLKDEPTADLDRFISESLRSDYPEWFNGSGASGGGASRSTVGGGGKTVIPRGDDRAFINNLEAIASGQVEVR